jgi:putative transposase
MKQRQAFKFELKPKGAQIRLMRRFAGACRFVYNKALSYQNECYQADNSVKFNYTRLANLLPTWKQDTSLQWLNDSPSQTLQQALKNLESAFKNFFSKRADFPRFKKKGLADSFRFPQGYKLEQGNNRLFLPKLGWIRYRNSRPVRGDIKNITVSHKGGKWFAAIQTEREVKKPMPVSASSVGIDVGIARFATLSDATYFEPLNSFKNKQAQLAFTQRAMARKIKFSGNWHKNKHKLSKLHTKISNARRDFLHKSTTQISKNHAMVCIEDLQVRNMSKSAKGTMEAPGRNIKAKSGLNRAILDQGWFEFRRQLQYKLDWNGGYLIAVNPKNTSRTCPCCKHTAAENRQTQAQFACVDCGYENNADVVGAINILAAGHAVLACGETVRSDRSMKQEPTEVIQASA